MTERLWMLDTDTSIELIRGQRAWVQRRMDAVVADPGNRVAISAIVNAELTYGLVRRAQRGMPQPAGDEFLKTVDTIPWDERAAAKYGEVRVQLEMAGQLIGREDMTIAAHAIVLGATLVTNNVKHFVRLSPPLRMDNWVDPASDR
jgi:tRNA(fMet)-specific endonuclease VapC